MSGHVFQTHMEQSKRGQFQDTLNMLIYYVLTAFKEDIRYLALLFSQLKDLEVQKPVDPVETEIEDDKGKGVLVVNKFEEMVFQENVKQWIQDTKSLRATTKSLCNIVWVQCIKLMQNKLLAVTDFDNIETTRNMTRLLKEVRNVSHQMENSTSIYDALDKAKMRYYEYRQGEHESNATHLKNFKDIVEVIEHP